MTSFERVPIAPDTLYLTPSSDVIAALQPVPGGEAVAVGFTDHRAGAIRVLLHPEIARQVMDGIAQVLAHAPYLRAANSKIIIDAREGEQ